MTTPIDLCNRALMRLGTQSAISSLNDGSVEASVCNAFYDDVLLSLLAHPASVGGPVYTWQWCRCVGTGIAVASDNPRWRYEIALPADSVRVLRVDDARKTHPENQRMKLFKPQDAFGEGMGKAGGTTLRPIILTDHESVSVTYITKSVDIDYWPAPFRHAFWLCLASSIATTLGIDGGTAAAVSQEAQREVERACLADQRVDVVQTEVLPDWLATRFSQLERDGHDSYIGNTISVGYVAGGNQPPSPIAAPYAPPMGPNGVIPTGLTAHDIGADGKTGVDDNDNYRAAFNEEARPGVLVISQTPLGWRAPYHPGFTDTDMTDSEAP